MLGRINSIAIFNPWLKPLIKNVSNIAVKLLNEMLRFGAYQKSIRATFGKGKAGGADRLN